MAKKKSKNTEEPKYLIEYRKGYKWNQRKDATYKYMSCKLCGQMTQVGDDATAVTCTQCVMEMVEPPQYSKRKTTSGRPAGWHFMAEFVDKDGNVFHKGKEQPKLKGTLKPTKIEPKKDKKKLSKSEKMRLQQAILQQMAMVRGQLKKAKWKKDINAGSTQLRKLQRQLKKIK